MPEIHIDIPGYVQPKQRTFGRGWVTPPETRAYEKLVRQISHLAMKGSPPLIGYIALEITITCEVPKSWSSKKRGKALRGEIYPTSCDIDNQAKAICDGMNKVVFLDDRFVNSLIARRVYGESDGAKIIVSMLE
jgi:Holliday junction resolvase RusA-like endonuclease